MKKRWRNAGLYVLLAVVVIAVGTAFLDRPDPANAPRTLRYSDFVEAVEGNEVSRVLIAPDRGTAQVVENNGQRAVVNLAPDKDLLKLLEQHKVDIAVEPSRQAQPWQQAIGSLIFPLLLLGGLFFLLRRAQGGGGNPAMNFGKSKARVQMEPQTQVTFGDVAGIEGAKLELTEVVDFLKNPDRFTAVGAKIPKGVLLVGPPGTGKTLLAKAVAGEAGVPFFSISGSEFVEMFVGVGASRVRDLFEQAKKNAPCIVFIDEIDAVGRQRGAGLGGGNDEREQTLNQLLTEMDGFEGNTGIIIVAATNRPDVLDAALMRPGRFDRQVVVDRPDYAGRLQILGVHARGKTLAKDVDLDKIARRTPGYTGADLANLLNEAAILAARRELTEISMDEVNDAIERVMAGPEKKDRVMSEKRKRLVAYHEAGHALVGALMPDYDPVQKISIIPRGNAGGLTFFTPSEERMESGLYSRAYLQNQMAVALGGRVAEEIVYGEDEVTTGASNDLQQVARVARQMVTRFGMSDRLGPVALGRSQGGMFLGRDIAAERDFSEDTAAAIDEEVSQLV
ncbi:ATP-dependent zinc metalloprotease FtsH, partial [Vulcanococcus sp.]|uniref:ATP-dependent zinc metalloprotease FtsH n=1 Tax=Vulcanococcus sp. TaxID=2856995 RepID=UPI0037D9FAC7